MENQVRRATLVSHYFDVMPADPAAPACLKGLKGGFFRCEPRRIVLGSHYPTTIAVSALRRSKDSLNEARCALEDFANSRNFDNVYPNGDDHRRPDP